MKKVIVSGLIGVVSLFALAVVASAIVTSKYDVATSNSTGKCQWVEKEGKRVDGGCKMVQNGTIKTYDNIWVK